MNCFLRTGIGAALAVLAAAAAGLAQPPALKEIEECFVQLHEKVGPCVVNIEKQGPDQEYSEQMEDLFRYFGRPAPEGPRGVPAPVPKAHGTGSGFIYDPQGHVITNHHVVENADSITVKLWNGKEYEAQVIGADPETDLAVLKIDAGEDLPAATLGDSETLKVGQFAIAIGSARGLEGSVSFGHISALGRENLPDLRAQGLTFQNLIQTDAAINLGNSGGPLCNINGEVIGINTALVLGANRIGFAIPINTVKRTVPELISKGKVFRGYLGVAIDDAKEFALAVGLPDEQGAFVKRVQTDTPAERAGLRTYDVIRKVNGLPIKNAESLVGAISSFTPDTVVNVEVWRDQAPLDVQVKLEVRNLAAGQRAADREVLGMRLQPLTPEVLERLGMPSSTKGVGIAGVKAGSPADDAQLMSGDVIIEAARKPVAGLNEFMGLMEEHAAPGAHLLVRFLRDGEDPDVTVLRIPKP